MRSLIPKDIQIFNAGAAPVVAAMCREINLRGIVDSMVKWDSKQCRLSPGTLIEALVINVLTARKPLYRVQEFYRHYDLEVLFGQGITADAFNDDALGRALTKLAHAHPQKVYLALALSAIKVHDIKVTTLHADTTSISVAGRYNDEEEPLLNITYGFSKDHRPDLKQFIYGLISSVEGIPLFVTMHDGNLADKTWNKKVLQEIDAILPPDTIGNYIYVADSAMVTSENLDIMASKGIAFISRLPETFSLADEIKEWAWEVDSNDWIEIGKLSNKKDAATYRLKTVIRDINGRPYRFITVSSSSLDERKEKQLSKKVEQEKKNLEKACQELARKRFNCLKDAQEAAESFIAEYDSPFFVLSLDVVEETKIKRGRGRPRKDEPGIVQTYYRLQPTLIGPVEGAVATAKEKAGIFILVTNVLSEEELPAIEVLKTYKKQTAVELNFRFLKDPVYVDGIYMKNSERVVGIGYVFLMALLIYALLQRRVRINMAKENALLTFPGKRKSSEPTGQMILDMLSTVEVARIETDDEIIRQIPRDRLTEDIKKLLRFAGFSEEIYYRALNNSSIID